MQQMQSRLQPIHADHLTEGQSGLQPIHTDQSTKGPQNRLGPSGEAGRHCSAPPQQAHSTIHIALAQVGYKRRAPVLSSLNVSTQLVVARSAAQLINDG